MNEKPQAIKKSNKPQPWYVRAMKAIGVKVDGLTRKQVIAAARQELGGRSKHSDGRSRRPHAVKRKPGRSPKHVRPMGRSW